MLFRLRVLVSIENTVGFSTFAVRKTRVLRVGFIPTMMSARRCTLWTTLVVVLTLGESFQSPTTHSQLFRKSSDVRTVTFLKAASEETNLVPSSSEPSATKTLLQTLDEAGQSLKPKAVKAGAQASLVEKKVDKILYILKTCCCYSLFIVYRAYRGFFVVLPAVFREVYQKMSKVVDMPFDDVVRENSGGDAQDINPETGKVRWRTRVIVSFLSAIVTTSYVIGGAGRVLTKFVRTITQTSSVSDSFAAAADEQESNEVKILRMTNNKINGEKPSSFGLDRLAP